MTKLIRKTQQPSDYPSNQIHDAYSTSTTDTYSCNYINSIVESGSNANGDYIKYSDGTMICTKKVTGQANITSAWGNLYDTGDNPLDLGDWAIPFIDVPIVSISFYGANGQWVKGLQISTTKEKVGKISIASATSKKANAYYNIIGIGKWR